MFRRVRPVAALLVCWAWAAPSAAQWTATILHPDGGWGSYILAVNAFQQFGSANVGAGPYAPGYWSGSSASWTSLAPGGKVSSVAGGQLGGDAYGHATIWNGPSHTPVNLHPAAYQVSQINATTGARQAGESYAGGPGAQPRAGSWQGSAQSFSLLHPSGAFASVATAADGEHQGGWVRFFDGPNGTPGIERGVVWSGSAQSMIELDTTGGRGSIVYGMSQGQIVGGVGGLLGGARAALWPSITAQWIDLNPPGINYADVRATCGSAQVGSASTNEFGTTAVIWFGSAETFTPLNGFLPPGYGIANALCVAEANGVYYVGGWAQNNLTGRNEAVLWVGVPAPGPLTLISMAGLFAVRGKRLTN